MTPELVDKNTILRVLTGSQSYGITVGSTGDRDELGVAIEPFANRVGFEEFEHYDFRTAAQREGKHDAKSQPGDLDLKIYGLRKFLNLALKGNPTIIELFFNKEYVTVSPLGTQLQALYPYVVSQRCGRAFLGYMQAQRMRLKGERGGKDVNRPDLVEKYGFDTKYAGHIIRLGMQGVELMSTGMLSIPMKPSEAEAIRWVRTGKYSLDEVSKWGEDLEADLKKLLNTQSVQPEPRTQVVQEWMLKTYWNWWSLEQFRPEVSQLIH